MLLPTIYFARLLGIFVFSYETLVDDKTTTGLSEIQKERELL